MISKETRKKISEAGKKSWSEGRNTGMTGKKMSKETRRKMSESHKNVNLPQRFKKGMTPWNKGKTHLRGEKHWNWKGGIDVEHTRISDTFENVGSTDWMPAWASRLRIEDINPSFDVYSLGKTLWSMVSDSPVLRLWYFNEDEFNLENKFPNTKYMQLVNELLSKCVVEKEEACELQNADNY